MSFSLIRNCPSCGAKNRVPTKHLAHTGRCGVCKKPLPPLSEPVDVDASVFQDIVSQADVPVLVDFWASWCGPCHAAAPEVRELAKEMAGKAIVLKVNTEEQPELSSQFGVQSIPNFVVLRNGKVALQRAGVAPRSEMRRWLETAVAA